MTDEKINGIERRLLQFLCNGASNVELRREFLARLRGYAFRSVEHQVLFDCLQGMPVDRPELLRELLPARLVRAGFPDFDLAPFFDSLGESAGEPHGLSAQEARELCQALTGSHSPEGNDPTGKQAAGLARGDREPTR